MGYKVNRRFQQAPNKRIKIDQIVKILQILTRLLARVGKSLQGTGRRDL